MRIQAHLEMLNKRMEETRLEIEELKDKYVKEVEDVHKLEDKSLNSVFGRLLGNDEQALEHERQESLWAFMRLEKAQKAMEVMKYEKSILVQKLISFVYEEEVLEELLKKKEKFLMQFPQMRIKLKLLDHEIQTLNGQQKEIAEALEVTEELIAQFEALNKELSLVSNWNQASWEYYGKGNYSSYKKKLYIKRNLELIPRIELLNQKLQKELEDLKQNHDIDFTNNLTLLNNFFVLFFDNLITDWIVRNGIISSLKTVEMSLSKLKRMEMMLKHEWTEVKENLRVKTIEREETVIKAKGKGSKAKDD